MATLDDMQLTTEPAIAMPTRRAAAGMVGSYVATNIYEGRSLFEVLGDEYVEVRRDDYPDLLSALASDEVVVRAVACCRGAAA
jgi:hypothetical protein